MPSGLAFGRWRCCLLCVGKAALKFFADESDKLVDLLLVELVFEGGHAVAAFGNLLGKLFIRVFERVPYLEAWDFQFLAEDFDRAALAVQFMTSGARLCIDGAHGCELVCGRRRRGRRCGGSGLRVGCRRCRCLIRSCRVVAGDDEKRAACDQECELD
jgi:hypothetical protein